MAQFKTIVSRRRKEHEIPTLRVAVQNFCRECMGFQPSLIEGCSDPQCWLFPWRLGKTPPALRSKVQRSAAQVAAGQRLGALGREAARKRAGGHEHGLAPGAQDASGADAGTSPGAQLGVASDSGAEIRAMQESRI